VQGEAKNILTKGSVLYFYAEAPLVVGDKLTLANFGKTIRTTAMITDNRTALYEAIIITDELVQDRRDLTEIM
jgi:hypothetical protein